MRVFFSSAILVGMGLLSIASLQAQVPDGDPDYVPPQIVTTPGLLPPKEALESRLGGTVRVKVSIDEAGNVTSAEDARGPGPVCQQVTRPDVIAMRNAAREAAVLAKFTPATRNGKPVASFTWLNFTFPGSSGESRESAEETPAPPPSEGTKYTIKGDRNYSVANVPPPDYRGPVNVGGSAAPPDAPRQTDGTAAPKQIRGGVLNGKALSLAKPPYPPAARAVRAEGAVTIQVLIDENGEVFSAHALSGHPLLRAVSAQAACSSKFSPTQLSGFPVKVSGVITYNFVP